MKKVKYFFIVCFLVIANATFSQETDKNLSDSTGLPGDHFSLQGALEMFKSATSLEDFEKKLNDENNYVNNLDLNGDGEIDYIRVVDNMESVSHAIILQVPISETESQDIAVIEIEKNATESAIVQIVGDDELYGESKIVEPFDENATNTEKKGPAFGYNSVKIIINVWFWPCVKFIYAPAYVVYASPWKWHYYPNYWKPWRQHPWAWYYNHGAPFRVHYQFAPTHRVILAHKLYKPHRKTSIIVVNRYKVAHANHKIVKAKNNPNNKQNLNKGKPGPNKQKNQIKNSNNKQGPKANKNGKR